MSNITSIATTQPISITLSSASASDLSPSLQLLVIMVPTILTPIVAMLTWYVKSRSEEYKKNTEKHHEEKKKHTLERTEIQIKNFYWPLYLNLIRYKQLLRRYNEFKLGHFSLSGSNEDPKDLQSNFLILPSIQQPPLEDHVIDIPILETQHMTDIQKSNISIEMIENSHSEIDTVNIETASSEMKNIQIEQPVNSQSIAGGFGLKNSIKIIKKFNRAISDYEKHMCETLLSTQKIYSEYAPIAEPGTEFLKELIKLDDYISYMISFREPSETDSIDSFLEDKISKAKFPDGALTIIENRLHYLQSLYNEIIYNFNSNILEKDDNPTGFTNHDKKNQTQIELKY